MPTLQHNSSTEPEYMTVNQVMQYASVSRRTVYNWMNRGTITWVFTPSGTRRILRSSIFRLRAA